MKLIDDDDVVSIHGNVIDGPMQRLNRKLEDMIADCRSFDSHVTFAE